MVQFICQTRLILGKYFLVTPSSRLLFAYCLLSLFLPPTRAYPLKRFFLRLSGIGADKGVRVVSSARFYLTGALRIGEDTFIGHDVLIAGGNAPIDIGKRCDIAPRVLIVNGSHKIDANGLRVAGEGFSSAIVIGDGCWIGAGAVILGGTVLGENCVVAAGAVVKGSFPDKTLIGGVPAREIRAL